MEPNLQDIQKSISDNTTKLLEVQQSIEKMRKYFLITAWVTILVVIIPLLVLMLIGPSFVSTYTGSLQVSGE
jgi:hypothetical protein